MPACGAVALPGGRVLWRMRRDARERGEVEVEALEAWLWLGLGFANPDPNPNPDPNQIEAKLLNGQKLQGTITAKDVATVLTSKGKEAEFPLFMRIHEIAFEGKPVSSIIDL